MNDMTSFGSHDYLHCKAYDETSDSKFWEQGSLDKRNKTYQTSLFAFETELLGKKKKNYGKLLLVVKVFYW